MKVLVTGGTGFIGSNIVRALLDRGDDVVITGHDAEQKIPGFTGKMLQPSFIGLDWEALGKLDAVIHEAAINETQSKDEREMMRVNVDASLALFEHAAKQGCKKFVYASSAAVYGDGPVPYKEGQALKPLTPYARSKMILEEKAAEFAKAHGATVVGLRYCNVYGPGESHKEKRASMVYQIAQQMKMGNPKLFTDGTQKRDYIYVKDVVRANLLALEAKESCVVNCGSGHATSFNELVSILNETLDLSRTPEYFSNPIAATYQNHTECDMTLAKQKLGFVPEFDIKRGITDYFKTGALV
ncbi:NAD-dependent epimerase/dehydratase family protein [Candidatus Kaiserbacteria bacterium]|nr:NAD-dependent epimerase/dehydratase family protein [Candidatus Kaiserbacteria bacterium]